MINVVVELLRDVNAIQIPSGDELPLKQGETVHVSQLLGGSYTVSTQYGLARISKNDADALGLDAEKDEETESSLPADAPLEDRVWDTLKNVYDPEIPVDIVNLGLIYDVTVTELENHLNHVAVQMTLTAPGCGMGPHLMMEAKSRIEALDGVEVADVDLVWDPPWNQAMVSEEGKMKLGLI